MQFVYATGRPRNMDFAITSRQEAIPSEAIIYATCYGQKAIENIDDDTFSAMTDEEFYTYKSLVQDARRSETNGAQRGASATAGRLLQQVSRGPGINKAANQDVKPEGRSETF